MTVLGNMTATTIKIMSSPAHKRMEQREEADIAVAAEDEHGGCCSGIDPNTLKALERITDSIVKFKLNRGAVGLEVRIVSVKDTMDLLQDKVATGLKWQLIDDLENCGCRCTVRLVGLPEDTVGKDSMKFTDT